MLAGMPDKSLLRRAMLVARTLSMAIDVVKAASLTASRPTRLQAQQIVGERIHKLDRHLQLGAKAWAHRPSQRIGR